MARYGNINLGSASKIINSPNPTSAQDVATKAYVDGLAGGSLTVSAIASEALVAGDFVNLYSNAGTLTARESDADIVGREANGFVLSAVSNGGTATVYLEGGINTGVTGQTIGKVYTSATAGLATSTPPTSSGFVQELGFALSATSIYFSPRDSVMGTAYRSQATIQRAANTTAYTANDVYGAAFQLTNIGPSGGYIILNNFRVVFNISALPTGMGIMTLYLYDVTPPSAVADNGAFSVPSGDRASLITVAGLQGAAALAQGGGSVVMTVVDINRVYKLATGSTSLFGYLVTTGAFTPAAVSETATITAKALGV